MVKTIRKTGKFIIITTAKAESPAPACETGFVFPGGPA